MKNQMLYKDLARYYDLIYSFKDYKKEAEHIKSLIKKYKKTPGKDVLEVACGTGKHAAHLKKDFRITGVDLNQGMLSIARKNVKGVTFKKADMTKLNLKKEFDVILCLFSSIGYVKTYPNLKNTIKSFSKHLKPNGIVIIEPWFTKDAFMVDSPHMTTHNGEDIKIARMSVSKARGIVSVLDMHYLIAEYGKEVKHFIDRHELGMFDLERMEAMMEKESLKTRIVSTGRKNNRGLLVGVKKLG